MAAKFVSAGVLSAFSAGTTITTVIPPEKQAKDIAVLCVMTNNVSTFSTPTNWNVLGTGLESDAGQSSKFFWKRLVGGDADPVTTTAALSGTNGGFGRVYLFRDCIETGNPFQAVGNDGTSATDTPLTSAVATDSTDHLVASIVMWDTDHPWLSGMPPSGWQNIGGLVDSAVALDTAFDAIARPGSGGTVASVEVAKYPVSGRWRTVTFALIPQPGKPTTSDLIVTKLTARYPTEGKTLGDLLRRYKTDQGLTTYEQYVDHVSPSSASQNIGPAATTPDHASLALGDLDVRILCDTDWTPELTHWMAGQGDHVFGANLSWAFSVHGSGKFRTAVSADGVIFSGPESTVPLVHTGLLWIRSTVDVNNGAGGKDFAYYTSLDGSSWVQLGTTVTEPGAITLFNSAAVLGVPGVFGGPQRTLYMELRNGINGTIVANPDFRGLAPGTTSFVDSTGKTWTVGAGGAGAVGNYGPIGDAENIFWNTFVP